MIFALERKGLRHFLITLPFMFLVGTMAEQMISGGRVTQPKRPLPPAVQTPIVNFVDIARQAGVTGVDVAGSEQEQDYIVETIGNGVAVFDYDNDGLPDIFIVNGDRFPQGKSQARNYLYYNLGGLRFEDVTEQSGLLDSKRKAVFRMMQKKGTSIRDTLFSQTSFVKRARVFVLRRLFVITMLVPGLVSCASAQAWGNPIWSDEFNTTVSGAPPDSSKWTFDAGGDGWGNRELEVYCVRGSSTPAPCDANHPNAFQDGHGHLVIQALRTSPDPAPTGTWTSARLKTLGLKDFQYGRLESCMKLPVAAGLWPAFWMLGTAGEWPAGGEMDIMENVPETGGAGGGLGPTVIESTIHGPSTAQKGIYSLAADFTLPNGKRIDDADPSCHVYGTIWSPFMVQIYVDDWRKPFFIRTASDVPPGGRWIFNAPFYFILNLAVGGEWPGPPNTTTPSPSEMVVDYVRVYKASREDGPTMSAFPISVKAGAVGSTTVHLASAPGSGYVYLACSAASANATCSVDTGNSLNASVVDFSDLATQMAKVTVMLPANSGITSGAVPITVTAYTVSGDQSTLSIPVERN